MRANSQEQGTPANYQQPTHVSAKDEGTWMVKGIDPVEETVCQREATRDKLAVSFYVY